MYVLIYRSKIRQTFQRTLHFSRWQTCSIRHQLDFSGKYSTMLQLCAKTIHSHSTTVYSHVLFYTTECAEENENARASKQ